MSASYPTATDAACGLVSPPSTFAPQFVLVASGRFVAVAPEATVSVSAFAPVSRKTIIPVVNSVPAAFSVQPSPLVIDRPGAVGAGKPRPPTPQARER